MRPTVTFSLRLLPILFPSFPPGLQLPLLLALHGARQHAASGGPRNVQRGVHCVRCAAGGWGSLSVARWGGAGRGGAEYMQRYLALRYSSQPALHARAAEAVPPPLPRNQPTRPTNCCCRHDATPRWSAGGCPPAHPLTRLWRQHRPAPAGIQPSSVGSTEGWWRHDSPQLWAVGRQRGGVWRLATLALAAAPRWQPAPIPF